jgi:hypothetical protein
MIFKKLHRKQTIAKGEPHRQERLNSIIGPWKQHCNGQLGNRQDIAEILLKVTLSTIALTLIIPLLFDIIETQRKRCNERLLQTPFYVEY